MAKNVLQKISWGLTGLMFALRISARMKSAFSDWKKQAESKTSPGGKDITPEELAAGAIEFSEILSEELAEVLPFQAAVQVIIVPTDQE